MHPRIDEVGWIHLWLRKQKRLQRFQVLHGACDLMARRMEHELSCLPASNHFYNNLLSAPREGWRMDSGILDTGPSQSQQSTALTAVMTRGLVFS